MDNLSKLKEALPIIETLEAHGHTAFIVGGAVRNYLLDIPINDVDITTSALPDEVEQIFARTVPVGKEHGTIMVLDAGVPFEVTTYRIDGEYKDFRRPDDVIFVSDLKEDLLRRDFTINALALDRDFRVIDYTGGQNDLQHHLIRAVGNPYTRFYEDALRMLRACRFQSVLDFQIENSTMTAMNRHSELIRHIAIERIILEFRKLLQGKNPKAAMKTMEDSALHTYIPVLDQLTPLLLPEKDVTLEAYFGFCLYKRMITVQDIVKLKLSNHEVKAIKDSGNIYEELFSAQYTERLLLYYYGKKLVVNCLQLLAALQIEVSLTNQQVDSIYRELTIKERADIAVDGYVLMTHLSRQGGSWLKSLLSSIEEQIVLGKLLNNKEDILKWVDNNVKI
ncbi:CCA tRNA nucleotidyltransferase [Macrococcus lamae]|uniref:CCA tRNA nucleotidyltransferase n=1 Tax=Macrococcus lamae TaxID=198484 RepID=A0A4R6BXL4_9STAP|nr:CCA tRNA nucleotidyltransferase [Macrococcus lamae]TDM13231.1 CCA tRNA nucleotidyltransferase [Macrococcus lamae]